MRDEHRPNPETMRGLLRFSSRQSLPIWDTMVPSLRLLGQFSTSIFNPHALHLDREYCQQKEGHRNILVHSPLSLVLMLETQKVHLIRSKIGEVVPYLKEMIRSVDFESTAPLYAEEETKICVKQKSSHDNTRTWYVWIEVKDGGYAVKGLVKTKVESRRKTRCEPGAQEAGSNSWEGVFNMSVTRQSKEGGWI